MTCSKPPSEEEPSEEDKAALKALTRRPTSLMLRHLDCGSCNGCEQQLIALTNPCYDIEQYGIAFEASPRHAVLLAMTGIFTRGLAEAARLTLEAMPKQGIATIGDCAINGGGFQDSYAVWWDPSAGVSDQDNDTPKGRKEIEPLVKLWIEGCPPTPMKILYKLARFIEEQRGQ
jgi:Ni,Fe-hydrogenase III small subunit